MDNFKIKLGIAVKSRRLEQKKTRDALADAAKISSRFLYEIETGRKGMSAETLYGLAKALDVSADCLLGGEIVTNMHV